MNLSLSLFALTTRDQHKNYQVTPKQ